MLRLENVDTYYGLICALRGVSLDVPAGRIVAVLGNNGAGKTTLLKTVMGLLDDQPDKGSIVFEGARIDGRETEEIVQLGIGYVPEGREVFDELTVEQNLLIGGYLRKDRSAVRLDLDRIYSTFPPLKDRRTQLAGTLSGGEQQMLAIGRALMNRPRLLLLDEPSLGLAPRLVREIFDVISEIHTDGVTVVLVEQNARMALSIAHTGYVMESGRFVASGTADELLQDDDVQEFYLGQRAEMSIKGYQRYKRRKRWR